MFEFNKNIKIVPYELGSIKEADLGRELYHSMIQDLEQFINPAKDFVVNSLETFASDSFVQELAPAWLKVTTTDIEPTYLRNGINQCVEICGDLNNLPIRPKTFDCVFTTSQFGYGSFHNSIEMIESIIRPGGLLIIALSKFLFYREFFPLLLCSGSRPWQYARVCSVGYKIADKGNLESSKFFCYYRRKG